jgi:hypothetical protein
VNNARAPYRQEMRVSFTKDSDRRYTVAVERARRPALMPRRGPGNDPYLPHDLAYLLVEIEFGIRLGVFGQLAAGGSGIFSPEPSAATLRNRRADARIGAMGRSDMARSERLTYLCVSQWERRVRRRATLPPGVDEALATAEEVDLAVQTLDREARRWHRLPIGGSVGYAWPTRLEFDPAGTHRGRRARRALTDRR